MSQIPLTGLTTLNLGSQLDPMFSDLYGYSKNISSDTGGNVMIGTAAAAGKLTVANSAASTDCASFTVTATASAYGISISSQASAANTVALIRGNAGGSQVFSVAGNGNVTNSNNSYGSISDIKLKQDICDASPKLAGLLKVRIVNYKLKSDPAGQKHLGVIAQELELVFPGMVDETPDTKPAANEGDGTYFEHKPTGAVTKSVKYSVFVPMLIKAIQEQQAQIEAMANRLSTLESR